MLKHPEKPLKVKFIAISTKKGIILKNALTNSQVNPDRVHIIHILLKILPLSITDNAEKR